jgi:para-aminobenzoate synthetase component 1
MICPQVQLDSSTNEHGWHQPLARAQQVLICDSNGRTTCTDNNGQLVQSWQDPLEALAWMAHSIPEGSRWIGYLSYDLGCWFEAIPSRAKDDLNLPLFAFGLVPVGCASAHHSSERCAEVHPTQTLFSTFTRGEYEHAVARVIDYIRAGDVFQVNLSQRFTASLPCTPYELYQRLQSSTPAKYAAFLDFGQFSLISNSPELFLKVDRDRRVITRPIKGTRPHLPGMDEQLRQSAKDTAELNMIIDMERNDLGRVCEIGSVQVTEARIIEAHPTVYQGVATIEGRLRDDVTFVDLLRATFPGGSITGAPKIRAMEIIEELEPVRRGPYCGAIGYLARDGEMQFNLAIRTMIAKGERVQIPVGGGIVADSVPSSEYEETIVKAKAMFDALGVRDFS